LESSKCTIRGWRRLHLGFDDLPVVETTNVAPTLVCGHVVIINSKCCSYYAINRAALTQCTQPSLFAFGASDRDGASIKAKFVTVFTTT
jgi:hypothetical protein